MQSASEITATHRLPARLPKGFELGDYVVDGWVRDGGMAAIYRAVRASDGARVALKLQLPSTAHRPEICARFDREAEAMRRIAGGPNVIELLDADVLEDGRRYFVMEWVVGEDLDELLDFRRNQDQRLSIAQACRIGRAIANGLATVHEHQLVHRDLKPANVMIGEAEDGAEIVKLVDFGIVADLRPGVEDGEVPVDEEIMGTSAYMAPEQVAGEPPEPRIDLFALGVVLYEVLTGSCVPPDGWSPETLPAIETLRRGVPVELAELVRSCMSRDPAQRPESAALVAGALVEISFDLEAGQSGPPSSEEIPIRTGGTELTPLAEVEAAEEPVVRTGETEVALTHQQVLSISGRVRAPRRAEAEPPSVDLAGVIESEVAGAVGAAEPVKAVEPSSPVGTAEPKQAAEPSVSAAAEEPKKATEPWIPAVAVEPKKATALPAPVATVESTRAADPSVPAVAVAVAVESRSAKPARAELPISGRQSTTAESEPMASRGLAVAAEPSVPVASRGQTMSVEPVPARGQTMAVEPVPARGQTMAVEPVPVASRGQTMAEPRRPRAPTLAGASPSPSMLSSGAVPLLTSSTGQSNLAPGFDPTLLDDDEEVRSSRWWLVLLVMIPIAGGVAWIAMGRDDGAGSEQVAMAEASPPAVVVVTERTDERGPGVVEHSREGAAAVSDGDDEVPALETGDEPEASDPVRATSKSKPKPSTPRVRPKGPDKAECEAKREEAKAAKTGRNWNGVLKATSKRACWSEVQFKLERRRLRVEAHAELGNFSKCVKEGGSSSDKQTETRVNWCKKKLGT